MKKLYPVLPLRFTIEDIQRWIESVTRERQIDLQDYNNQISDNPRRIDTIPSSSTDTSGSEQVGDFAVDTTHFYIACL